MTARLIHRPSLCAAVIVVGGLVGCAEPSVRDAVPPPAYLDARELYRQDGASDGVVMNEPPVDSGDYPLPPPVTPEGPTDPGAAYYPPDVGDGLEPGSAYLGTSAPSLQQEFYLGRDRYLYDPFYDGFNSPSGYRSRSYGPWRYDDFNRRTPSAFSRPYYGWHYADAPYYRHRRSIGDDSHTPRRDDDRRPSRDDERRTEDRTPREPLRPDRAPGVRKDDARDDSHDSRRDDRPIRDARQAIERQRAQERDRAERDAASARESAARQRQEREHQDRQRESRARDDRARDDRARENRREEPRREEPRRESPRRDDSPREPRNDRPRR